MNKQRVLISELMPMIAEKIALGGAVTIRVKGTSMRPFFESEKTDVTLTGIKQALHPLDVVLYEGNNHLFVLHRIVKINGDAIFVCGDALMKNERITASQVIAIVSSFEIDGKVTLSTDLCYQRKVRRWVASKPLRPFLFAFRHHILGR
jgi:hypothetical protein